MSGPFDRHSPSAGPLSADAPNISTMGRTLLLGAATAAAIAAAAPAHADDQSYLRYLNEHGTRVMAFNDDTRIAYGYQACGMLRNGMSIDAIAGSSPVSDGRGIAEAAQHELCPDTLH